MTFEGHVQIPWLFQVFMTAFQIPEHYRQHEYVRVNINVWDKLKTEPSTIQYTLTQEILQVQDSSQETLMIQIYNTS